MLTTLTDNVIRIIDKTSENKLLEELETLRIDVAAECQYQDPTGALQDKYERANEMLDDCINCVRKYFNKSTI
jgi:hypothetical protein